MLSDDERDALRTAVTGYQYDTQLQHGLDVQCDVCDTPLPTDSEVFVFFVDRPLFETPDGPALYNYRTHCPDCTSGEFPFETAQFGELLVSATLDSHLRLTEVSLAAVSDPATGQRWAPVETLARLIGMTTDDYRSEVPVALSGPLDIAEVFIRSGIDPRTLAIDGELVVSDHAVGLLRKHLLRNEEEVPVSVVQEWYRTGDVTYPGRPQLPAHVARVVDEFRLPETAAS
jgi:hypothetical protein